MHWTPYNRQGDEWRFCSNPPFPKLRNSQDVAEYCACFDARYPRLYLRLQGLYAALERNARS